MARNYVPNGRPRGGSKPVVRPDDGRCKTAAEGAKGGVPFVPTDAQRARVKELSGILSIDHIADLMGKSGATIRRHFKSELSLGEAEHVEEVGNVLLRAARAGEPWAVRLFLKTRGKKSYSERIEVTGAGGAPIQHIDLTGYSDEQLAKLEQAAALLAGGNDRQPVVVSGGDPSGEGGEGEGEG